MLVGTEGPAVLLDPRSKTLPLAPSSGVLSPADLTGRLAGQRKADVAVLPERQVDRF